MKKISYQTQYFIFIILGAAVLLSAFFVFDAGIRISFILGLIYICTAQILQVRVIRSREFDSLHKLNYAGSWPDYLLVAIMLVIIIAGLVLDRKSSTYSFLLPLSFAGVMAQTATRIWIRCPRYILTHDRLLENDFYLKERDLVDLYAIGFDWTTLVVRVQFANEYDIKIFRPRYPKQELANFIQHIVDQAPVEADIHPEVQEFLKAHASPSIH